MRRSSAATRELLAAVAVASAREHRSTGSEALLGLVSVTCCTVLVKIPSLPDRRLEEHLGALPHTTEALHP